MNNGKQSLLYFLLEEFKKNLEEMDLCSCPGCLGEEIYKFMEWINK